MTEGAARESHPEDGRVARVPVERVGESEARDLYARRAKLGRIALLIRTIFNQFIILGGMIVLARELRPSEFGTFAMVQFVLSVFTLVGDAGLGGALVQKGEQPSQNELSTVFFAQLGLALFVFICASSVAPFLHLFWTDLPSETPWILRALAANFIFVSARVVPTLLLEREVLFVRVAILDTINSITFYLVASILAILGYGTWALVSGVLAQGILSFLAAIALRPWAPSRFFDWKILRPLLNFGVPYQARAALSLLTRSSLPVLVGRSVGSHGVGITTWALETAFFPLTFIDILGRVNFPLLSRLREDREAFAAELERTLRLGVAITLFISSLFLGLAEPLTEIIYSAQWLEAVPGLRFFAVGIALGMFPFLLASAFDALARPKIVLFQMTAVMVLAWVLSGLGLSYAGIDGFAAGYGLALFAGTMLIVRPVLKELPRLHMFIPFLTASVAGAAAVGADLVFLRDFARGPLTLVVSAVCHFIIYLVVLALIDKEAIQVLKGAIGRDKK